MASLRRRPGGFGRRQLVLLCASLALLCLGLATKSTLGRSVTPWLPQSTQVAQVQALGTRLAQPEGQQQVAPQEALLEVEASTEAEPEAAAAAEEGQQDAPFEEQGPGEEEAGAGAAAAAEGGLQVPVVRQAEGEGCLPPIDPGWPLQLPAKEGKIYSQNGEDGILLSILENIGGTNHFFVEFGTQDGSECNTRVLHEQLGWRGLLMDGDNENEERNMHKEFITPANINFLFEKYEVPDEFDVLVVDVDFDDLWIWANISSRYRPRVVITEYNGFVPGPQATAAEAAALRVAVDPSDKGRWTWTNYYGASLEAFNALTAIKGYSLVACDAAGVNAFWVRTDIVECQGVALPTPEQAHRKFIGHGIDTDPAHFWLFLDEKLNVIKKEHMDW